MEQGLLPLQCLGPQLPPREVGRPPLLGGFDTLGTEEEGRRSEVVRELRVRIKRVRAIGGLLHKFLRGPRDPKGKRGSGSPLNSLSLAARRRRLGKEAPCTVWQGHAANCDGRV